VLDLDPEFMVVHWGVGQLHERQGRYGEAIEAYTRSAALSHGTPTQTAALAHAYARAGHTDRARELLAQLLATDAAYVSPFKVALVHTGLGDRDQAFDWLFRACELRDGWVTTLKVAHEVAPLRTDPRFNQLLERVAFP
jgi:tetratricopeptide (TPR) repeat protein